MSTSTPATNSKEALKDLVVLRSVLQRQRIAFSNRIQAIERGVSTATPQYENHLKVYYNRFADMEEYVNNDITRISEDMEIIERLRNIRGVGPLFAAQLVGYVDIEKAETPSALQRYCGYGVEDGRAERRTKGQRISYNPTVKSLCWNISVSFLKTSSPYRNLYDKAKAKYEVSHPEWTKSHIHNASLRYMIKRFLAHFWVVWREIENLPTRVPYVEEYLGHTTIDKPEDYGW